MRWYGTPVDIDLVYDNQNTFTVLEFSNFIVFNQSIFKHFLKTGKITKDSAEFKLMTYIICKYGSNRMRYAVTYNNFGGKQLYKIMLDLLFISMESTSRYGGVPCHLNSD